MAGDQPRQSRARSIQRLSARSPSRGVGMRSRVVGSPKNSASQRSLRGTRMNSSDVLQRRRGKVRDQHRQALEAVRQEREQLREAGETARIAGEEAREAAEAARHAAVEAMHATAESLQATLESMKAIEEMRRTLRDIRDLNKLDPTEQPLRFPPPSMRRVGHTAATGRSAHSHGNAPAFALIQEAAGGSAASANATVACADVGERYASRTFSPRGPLGPWPRSNVTA